MSGLGEESDRAPLDYEFKVITWIGIINQLASALSDKTLADIDLRISEFTMLIHFHYRGEKGKTITQLSRERQQPQPGTTKIVQKLVDKGLIRSQPNKEDARSNLLFLTAKGRRKHAAAIKRLMPILHMAFAGIDDLERAKFFEHLDRLKCWFDANRDTLTSEGTQGDAS